MFQYAATIIILHPLSYLSSFGLRRSENIARQRNTTDVNIKYRISYYDELRNGMCAADADAQFQ